MSHLLALKWDMELSSGLCSPLCSPSRFSDEKLTRNVTHCYHSPCNKHLAVIANPCGSLAPLPRFMFWWGLPFSGSMNQACPQVTKLSFIYWKKKDNILHIFVVWFVVFFVFLIWDGIDLPWDTDQNMEVAFTWGCNTSSLRQKLSLAHPSLFALKILLHCSHVCPHRQICSQLPGEELHCAAWVGKGSRSPRKMHRWQQMLREQVRLCFHLCASLESWPGAGNICQRMS